jgi:hypothetical protein
VWGFEFVYPTHPAAATLPQFLPAAAPCASASPLPAPGRRPSLLEVAARPCSRPPPPLLQADVPPSAAPCARPPTAARARSNDCCSGVLGDGAARADVAAMGGEIVMPPTRPPLSPQIFLRFGMEPPVWFRSNQRRFLLATAAGRGRSRMWRTRRRSSGCSPTPCRPLMWASAKP